MQSYLLTFGLYLATLIGVSFYTRGRRASIDEMHGMMIGMTFGMVAGLVAATLFVIPTGHFLYAVIIGSVFGLAFGMVFGTYGGHLGVMEGVMAGPMGGMMGAMLGQMVRPFDLSIFIPFFSSIFLLSMIGISYCVHRGCCDEKKMKPLSNTFIYAWALATVVILLASLVLPYSLESTPQQKGSTVQTGQPNLPSYLQQLSAEERKETTVKDGRQDIDLQITASKYSPNVILAKKGIPLHIALHADQNAGCTREIVFPDFGIDKIVPAGGESSVEFTPSEGTFGFRCSMDMIHGKLVVS